MRRLWLCLILLSAFARVLPAQSVMGPPPFERARAGFFTLQMENAVAADNNSPYGGSWAFRLRKDWNAVALAGAVGAAFSGERAGLGSATLHVSLPPVGAGLKRLVTGFVADATAVVMDESGNVTNLSIGGAVGGEFDSLVMGAGVSVMLGARFGYLLNEGPAENESYFGSGLAASIGIMRNFALFAQLDYASASPREGEHALTFGSGLRFRIGEGR